MAVWKRNLIILWISLFVTSAGLSSVVPFLPLFIRELGITSVGEVARWSGLAFSAPYLLTFFVTPVWGAMGDRYGKKLMIERALYGLCIALVLIGFSQNVYQLIFFRLLQGLLSGFYPASMALAAAQAPPDKTTYSLGAIQSANISGNIIGPLIGGTLSDLVGYREVFILCGLLSGVLAIINTYLLDDRTPRIKGGSLFDFVDNWKEVLKSKYLIFMGVVIVLAAFGDSFVRPTFVLLVETLAVPKARLSSVTGILLSIEGFGAALSSVFLARRAGSWNPWRALGTSFLIMTAANFIQAELYIVFPYLPVRFILGLAYGMVFPILFAQLLSRVEKQKQGGFMGIGSSLQTLGYFTGPVAAGIFASVAGFRGCFVITGIIFALLSLIFFMKKTGRSTASPALK
jgi:DHA1 family multidrug resistance protein-like MFS transporter